MPPRCCHSSSQSMHSASCQLTRSRTPPFGPLKTPCMTLYRKNAAQWRPSSSFPSADCAIWPQRTSTSMSTRCSMKSFERGSPSAPRTSPLLPRARKGSSAKRSLKKTQGGQAQAKPQQNAKKQSSKLQKRRRSSHSAHFGEAFGLAVTARLLQLQLRQRRRQSRAKLLSFSRPPSFLRNQAQPTPPWNLSWPKHS